MENTSNEKKGLNISARSFVIAILVIFLLMVLTYILTLVIPGGSYSRITDETGRTLLDTSKEFVYTEGGIPFWKWLLSPILVLTADGSATILAVIVFLLIIGGVFNALEKCGLMRYMLDKIIHRYGKSRYTLLAIVPLFFMAMGAFVGSFEECVPMVPIVVALAAGLGFDALTGMGMSLLAVGCGFASGVCNPFTTGVAQELAGLPMFSGIGLRIVSFIVIYLVLELFLRLHAKKIAKPVEELRTASSFEKDPKKDRALLTFVCILGVGIVCVLCSAVVTALQDFTMIIVAFTFLLAGLLSVSLSGFGRKDLARTFKDGAFSILPAVLMILMASSIKYTLVEASVLDTILHGAVNAASSMPKAMVILFIYLIVLVMNFFIPSGSAKAFLLIPLIVPMAQIFGISAQLCVLAYVFGDGFSNVFYPTNPVLLIALGLSDVSYGKWAKYSGGFQLVNLLVTSGILLIGLALGYC